ncbi:MAG: hypothetical protein M3347_06295, partial [Armatimonadota bacterium]|nr:hypothetical protein [Armatimonadota bacterium]
PRQTKEVVAQEPAPARRGFDRSIERDADMLRAMCACWRQALPYLTAEQRESLLECIDLLTDVFG